MKQPCYEMGGIVMVTAEELIYPFRLNPVEANIIEAIREAKLNMEKGEKYLDIKIVGHDFIRAFPNNKEKENQPDFKGDGVAVWVREAKGKEETQKFIKKTTL